MMWYIFLNKTAYNCFRVNHVQIVGDSWFNLKDLIYFLLAVRKYSDLNISITSHPIILDTSLHVSHVNVKNNSNVTKMSRISGIYRRIKVKCSPIEHPTDLSSNNNRGARVFYVSRLHSVAVWNN